MDRRPVCVELCTQEFAPKFLEGYAKADRHKPSGVASKESILRIHLIPVLGNQTLHAITNAQVQRLKFAPDGQGGEDGEQRAEPC